MQVNRIQSNNYNNQPNFKGFVGESMKKYVSSQMERELTDLYTKDKKFGPFANTSIIADRVKNLHAKAQDKLNKFMKIFEPHISMEYTHGVVSLQNQYSKKSLNFIAKDINKGVTGKIYDNNIDMFSPYYVEKSGEITLYYIDNFANHLEKQLDVENINKTLAK